MPNEKYDLSVFAQAGLTQGEAAALCGVSRVTFHNWLKDKNTVRVSMRKHVAMMVVLTKIVLRTGKLPGHLPPSRMNTDSRRYAIEAAYDEARDILIKLRAKRQAS